MRDQDGRGSREAKPSGHPTPSSDGEGPRPKAGEPCRREKCLARSRVCVPESDTGRRVENTKAIGRTLVKELGNMAP